VKVTKSATPEFRGQALHVFQRGAAAHQSEVNVLSPQAVHDVAGRLQQVVDAFLLAHHAHVADQVTPAAPELRLGRDDLQPVQLGPAANDEHAAGVHATTFDGDAAVGLIRRDGDVCRSKGGSLQPHHQPPQQPTAAELGFVELGVDVVVVEDELRAEAALVVAAHQEQQVRRVAGVNHVEPAFASHLARQTEGVPQRCRVLQQVTQGALALVGQGIAMDVDALDALVRAFVAFAGRADDADLPAMGVQGGGLLPDPTVERGGKVLDQDQHTAAGRQLFPDDPAHQQMPS
jgi:hypothetical protein